MDSHWPKPDLLVRENLAAASNDMRLSMDHLSAQWGKIVSDSSNRRPASDVPQMRAVRRNFGRALRGESSSFEEDMFNANNIQNTMGDDRLAASIVKDAAAKIGGAARKLYEAVPGSPSFQEAVSEIDYHAIGLRSLRISLDAPIPIDCKPLAQSAHRCAEICLQVARLAQGDSRSISESRP